MDELATSIVDIQIPTEEMAPAKMRRRHSSEPCSNYGGQVASLAKRTDGVFREMTARTRIPWFVITNWPWTKRASFNVTRKPDISSSGAISAHPYPLKLALLIASFTLPGNRAASSSLRVRTH